MMDSWCELGNLHGTHDQTQHVHLSRHEEQALATQDCRPGSVRDKRGAAGVRPVMLSRELSV